MALTFYYGSGSQFAWRVFLALEHKQVPYELKVLSFSAREHKSPEFSAINPRQRVPAIDDDGFALFESAAIVEYLDERFPDRPALFPGGLRERALARRMIQEIDCYYGLCHEELIEELFFESDPAKRNGERIEAAKLAITKELSYWNDSLRSDFMIGPISAVDFALYPFVGTIQRFEKKSPDLGLSKNIGEKLGAWMKRVESLPFFHRTFPPHWR